MTLDIYGPAGEPAAADLSWKDAVRAASIADVDVSSAPAALDAVTLALDDRVLLKNQVDQTENGIYDYAGASAPLVRSSDADEFDELEGAAVVVEEGDANEGTAWRQTQVNGVLGASLVLFVPFLGTTVGPATEAVAGIAELATQVEADAGVDDARIVTPLKHATYHRDDLTLFWSLAAY